MSTDIVYQHELTPIGYCSKLGSKPVSKLRFKPSLDQLVRETPSCNDQKVMNLGYKGPSSWHGCLTPYEQ